MKNKSSKNTELLFACVIQFMTPYKTFAHQDMNNFLPYFRLDIGKSKFLNVFGSPAVIKGKNLRSDVDTITSAGIGLGIDLGDKIRSDITWTHHLYTTLRTDDDFCMVKRKPKIESYFLNLYYEIGSKISVFNPYLGAGIGIARISDKLYTSVIDNGVIYKNSQTIPLKNNFAYKFVFGSSFDLNESIKFDLEYNYHDYGKTKNISDKENNQIGKTHYRSHCLSAGLRFGM